MAGDGESLESWLNKATNPSNRQEEWEYIMGFCDQINKELEGPQISVRLLAHKIQSPQEWEALQALTVLEACMKNCERRFHSEVGKFRFLNELIKVVSPKYLGDRVSEKVKTKVIEMLYSWTVSLPDEGKISGAYDMLKKQGIVSVDPDISLDSTLIPSPPTNPKNPVFENEEKSKRLAELLKSKKPEDLQEANRLIKNMVKEDELRAKRDIKRNNTLKEVDNSVKLLNEMLAHFNTEDSTDGDKELIRELYGDCDKLRRTVFQLATETEDNDSSLGDILQASDDLSRVINSYKIIVEGQTINGEAEEPHTLSPSSQGVNPSSTSSMESEILIDLAGLSLQSPSPSSDQQLSQAPPLSIPADLLYGCAPTAPLQALDPSPPSAAVSLLDGDLLSLADPLHISSNTPKDEKWSSQLTSSQETSQDLDPFSSASLPNCAFSALSFDTDMLFSSPAAPAGLPQQSSATDPTLSFPAAASFPIPPFPMESASASLILPAQPLLGAVASAPPPACLAQSHSSTTSTSSPCSVALSGNAAVLPQTQAAASFSPCSVAPPASAPDSLQHSLQDLAMLDLDCPKSVMDPCSLLDLSEDVGALAGSSSGSDAPSSRCSPLLLAGVPAGDSMNAHPQPVRSQTDSGPLLCSPSPALPLSQASPVRGQEISLAKVFVPLDAITPSKVCPVTVYDKDGIRVLLHFATDCPSGRPDVLVMVVSMLNTAPLPVTNIILQAAVPKSMKVRLQPPSGTDLAPFNPILSPGAITQVMLLANPLKEKVRMRYKLTFTLGEEPRTEMGEVDQFPPAERWGSL